MLQPPTNTVSGGSGDETDETGDCSEGFDAGTEEAGAEPDDAPEEAGGRADNHRGEVRRQEEGVPGEQRGVSGTQHYNSIIDN